MSGVHARHVASYILLPGVIPRLRAFFSSGFGYIAFLMAQIYNMVRLLPPHHPYLDPQNIGRFGIRHVIAAAADHLTLSRRNIDQIIIFVALLAAVVILALQIVILLYVVVVQPALAFSSFETVRPQQDISFEMLVKVFGIPGIFCNNDGACVDAQAGMPLPFHTALHKLFKFYSIGMLIVGVLIFLYYVVVVVAETATTGSPFGKRFDNAWTPVRLVIALGLLVPLNYGMNSGQYLILYTAKYGAGFGTNGWNRFNEVIRDGGSGASLFPGGTGANPGGEKENFVGKPQPPDISPMVQFMSIAHGCAYGYWKMDRNMIVPDADTFSFAPRWLPNDDFYIKPYLVKNPNPFLRDTRPVLELTRGTAYTDALDFYDDSDIVIRFGRYDPDNFKNETGRVKPYCGEIRISISDLRHKGEGNRYGGPDMIQNYYFDLVKLMWFEDPDLSSLAQRDVELAMSNVPRLACNIGCWNNDLPSCSGGGSGAPPCASVPPGSIAKQNIIDDYQGMVNDKIDEAWNLYRSNGIDIQITDEMQKRGWAGAGIWYNTISQLNGSFITSILDVPSTVSYPRVMEQVRRNKLENDSSVPALHQFTPNISDAETAEIKGDNALPIAMGLASHYQYWNNDDANQTEDGRTRTGNTFEDVINFIFGTHGLFAMRGENAHVHPLAQLAVLGKGLVDASVRNIAGATVAATFGGPVALLSDLAGASLEIASNIVMSVAFLGITAGFVLYYILPFLPFLYFFFAAAAWVKGIFEAMVGMPLWALAHLRIDGEGLPGESASNGYFLLLEIFLRPILAVISLIAAMIIFAAQVRVLNFCWALVVDNLTSFDVDPLQFQPGEKSIPRNSIDSFFFTIIYAFIVYMLATASFKLIDSIPDGILRWGGSSAQSFGSIAKDPAGGLTQYAAIGGLTLGKPVIQGFKSGAQEAGQAVTQQFKQSGGELSKIFEQGPK